MKNSGGSVWTGVVAGHYKARAFPRHSGPKYWSALTTFRCEEIQNSLRPRPMLEWRITLFEGYPDCLKRNPPHQKLQQQQRSSQEPIARDSEKLSIRWKVVNPGQSAYSLRNTLGKYSFLSNSSFGTTKPLLLHFVLHESTIPWPLAQFSTFFNCTIHNSITLMSHKFWYTQRNHDLAFADCLSK